ncbi:hypothetical protein AAFF_G00256540 [Aldrovandia affinis]|uniref:Uncharacterized protein n=1 Tax=Aldrovandia affinis TaxID=143900 RepID=A0AAD7WTB2_9TELE|nr:hypothetical protein AAFF_G00256540 [Aldrovandia affinis]
MGLPGCLGMESGILVREWGRGQRGWVSATCRVTSRRLVQSGALVRGFLARRSDTHGILAAVPTSRSDKERLLLSGQSWHPGLENSTQCGLEYHSADGIWNFLNGFNGLASGPATAVKQKRAS